MHGLRGRDAHLRRHTLFRAVGTAWRIGAVNDAACEVSTLGGATVHTSAQHGAPGWGVMLSAHLTGRCHTTTRGAPTAMGQTQSLTSEICLNTPTLCFPACLALQTPTDKEWFQGTADAVRQYAWLLTDTKNRGIEDVVILSGDHL